LREESDYIHCNNLLVEETPVTSKRTKTNPGMTPEKYYAVHLVSSVLPLTATTHFLPDRSGNNTKNFKPEITNWQVTSNSIALQTTTIK